MTNPFPPSEPILIHPIGRILTGFETLADCPRGPGGNPGESVIELDERFVEGLTGIEEASHIWVLYWFDRADRTALLRGSRHNGTPPGVFASRSPMRPNPVALSVVQLRAREGARLRISGLDCLDGTPLIDLKPYVPTRDNLSEATISWQPPDLSAPSSRAILPRNEE